MEDYEDKVKRLEEQCRVLAEAGECVKAHVKELAEKIAVKVAQFAQSICRNDQVEDIDRKITALLKRREEKKKSIEKLQGELDELQENAEQAVRKTKDKVTLQLTLD